VTRDGLDDRRDHATDVVAARVDLVNAQRDVDRGIAMVVVDVAGDPGATGRARAGRPLDVEEVVGERGLFVRVVEDEPEELRVGEALGEETDLVLVTAMTFDDRAAMDAGLASDAMRAAGRNLRAIAPGLSTLLVLEDAPEMDEAASPGVDTVSTPSEGAE